MALTLSVNGQSRIFADLASPAVLAEVVAEMNLKADRVAVEHNGEIAPRGRWGDVVVASGDRLEVVHFVGGGASPIRRTGRDWRMTCGEVGPGLVVSAMRSGREAGHSGGGGSLYIISVIGHSLS